MVSGNLSTRKLIKADLGGVIFGCTHDTMKECLANQIFGLPGQHMSYVQNIEPGLPLFLFNYSDRKLYGIFEAESRGQLNINPYGWSSSGSEKTKYPAQVRIRISMQCEPLLEKQFKPIIVHNYHSPKLFWFEVDHTQARALLSLFGSSPVTAGSTKWIPRVGPKFDAALEVNNLTAPVPMADLSWPDQLTTRSEVSRDTLYEEVENEEQAIYQKLEQLALERKQSNSSEMTTEGAASVSSDTNAAEPEVGCAPETVAGATNKNEETSISDVQAVIHQLRQGMDEFKAFSQEQTKKTSFLENKLSESKIEIQRLKVRIQILESQVDPSASSADETPVISSDKQIFILGGYDGHSSLSSLDCYSLTRDVMRSLCPMSSVRSHAATAVLSERIYVLGGGNGSNMWYNTVEIYNPYRDVWTSCSPLSVDKGNLAAATLHGKLFAIGGGNSNNCLSEVEMFDSSVNRWVRMQSMTQKRFAPASAVLNGALYAVGGYDGDIYLNSAERFDPRADYWENIPSMNTSRGCHSLVPLNGKLYAIGGYDGTRIVPSVEVLDPRFGLWTRIDPMNHARGYAGAVVIDGSIYVIGGVQDGPIILDTVEQYKDDNGWLLTSCNAVTKRCFHSACVL
ncbi:hypothetical protein ACHQM5_013525 [Ranunculus cassubicifolius]